MWPLDLVLLIYLGGAGCYVPNLLWLRCVGNWVTLECVPLGICGKWPLPLLNFAGSSDAATPLLSLERSWLCAFEFLQAGRARANIFSKLYAPALPGRPDHRMCLARGCCAVWIY